MLRRAMPPRRRAILGLSLGVLADVCVVGLLALSMWLIVRAGEQPPILHLTFAIVGVRAFAIGRAAFRYAERLASHDAALAQLAELRSQTFEALVPRVPGAIESHRRGDVLTAFVDDVDQLQDEPLRVRQPLTVSLIVVGLSLVLLALIAPIAALVTAALLLVAGGASAWLSQRTSAESDRELGEARAALADALLERFSAAEVLSAFGGLEAQRRRIAEAEARLARAQSTRVRSAGLTAALLSLASGVTSVLVLLMLAPVQDGRLLPRTDDQPHAEREQADDADIGEHSEAQTEDRAATRRHRAAEHRGDLLASDSLPIRPAIRPRLPRRYRRGGCARARCAHVAFPIRTTRSAPSMSAGRWLTSSTARPSAASWRSASATLASLSASSAELGSSSTTAPASRRHAR